MLSVEFTYTGKDYARASRWVRQRMFATRFAYVVIVIAMALGLVKMYRSDPESWNWLIIPATAGFLFFVFVVSRVLDDALARRRWRSSPAATGSQTYSFGDDGIKMAGSLHNVEMKWEAIVKASESKNDFFLYVSKNMAHFLPKRVFVSSEQQGLFRRILKNNLGGRAKISDRV